MPLGGYPIRRIQGFDRSTRLLPLAREAKNTDMFELSHRFGAWRFAFSVLVGGVMPLETMRREQVPAVGP